MALRHALLFLLPVILLIFKISNYVFLPLNHLILKMKPLFF